jgi:hypothetical protein
METMEEWKYTDARPAEALAKLHFFSFRKQQASGEIEFRITIREHLHANIGDLLFFAEADKEINQKTLPYRPSGWGSSLAAALAECIRNIRRFDYEG